MDCLNPSNKRTYKDFDQENLQLGQSQGTSAGSASSKSGGGRRRGCLPVLLGLAALLLSTLALIMGVYAAVVARKLKGPSDSGVYFTNDPGNGVPAGWTAVNMFKVNHLRWLPRTHLKNAKRSVLSSGLTQQPFAVAAGTATGL